MTPVFAVSFEWQRSKRHKNFSSYFQGSPNALPRMASPKTGHVPLGCLGVPLSGWASLLPSDRGFGTRSLAGD